MACQGHSYSQQVPGEEVGGGGGSWVRACFTQHNTWKGFRSWIVLHHHSVVPRCSNVILHKGPFVDCKDIGVEEKIQIHQINFTTWEKTCAANCFAMQSTCINGTLPQAYIFNIKQLSDFIFSHIFWRQAASLIKNDKAQCMRTTCATRKVMTCALLYVPWKQLQINVPF